MSISINNSVQNIQNTSFKGKWDRTEQGVPYYKSNSATIAGGVLAVPAALSYLLNINQKIPTEAEIKEKVIKYNNADEKTKKILDIINKNTFCEKDYETFLRKGVEKSKFLKKTAIPYAVIAGGLTLGCGMIVDKIRNNKAKEIANYANRVGAKQAVLTGDQIGLTNRGNAYYESNTGSKYGALLGLGCGIAASVMSSASKVKPKLAGHIFSISTLALGGWIMGKIADSNTNKNARRH